MDGRAVSDMKEHSVSVMSVSLADNKVKFEIIILNCNWQRKVQRSRFDAKVKVQKWSQVDI